MGDSTVVMGFLDTMMDGLAVPPEDLPSPGVGSAYVPRSVRVPSMLSLKADARCAF